MRSRRAVLGVLVAGLLVAIAFLSQRKTERSSQGADDSPRRVEEAPLPTHSLSALGGQPSPRAAAQSSSPAAASVPTSAVAPPAVQDCTTDIECKRPRLAECIDAKCVQGQCVYDDRGCDCVSADDCDDGDPCTRNHCFSSTMKCIYIPIDDCKK